MSEMKPLRIPEPPVIDEAMQRRILMFAGIGILLSAVLILVESQLKTGWLLGLGLFVSGTLLLVGGAWMRRRIMLYAGILFACFGLGLLVQAFGLNLFEPLTLVGVLLASFGVGCLLILLFSRLVFGSTDWWALVPAALIGSTAIIMMVGSGWPYEFVFVVSALGLSLLAWGVARRLFGLIIPGCILLSIGPAIYFAWGTGQVTNPLVQTGIMLVWLAFGFILISLFSRVLHQVFIWWPFIPGGVLAMVGWGLYLGGDPDRAVGFIGNTGSIGLILFAIYLLLLRRGIHQ